MDSNTHDKKPKTHKGKLHLDSFKPKDVEDPKVSMILNTRSSNQILRMLLSDLHKTRREYSRHLQKKNEIACAFVEAEKINFFNERNNASLFAYANDTKKRPMNLVLGSSYDNKILDMFEFEVSNYIPIEYFAKQVTVDSCMKPMIIFQGDIFETDFQYARLRTFFLDFFRLHDVESVDVTDLRRVIIISVADNKEVKIRNYEMDAFNEYNYKTKTNLTEVGPSLNLKVRRIHLASESLYKETLRQPRILAPRKIKNITKNALGEDLGKVHMARQNIRDMPLKRYDRILGKRGKKNKQDAKNVNNNQDNNESENNMKPKNQNGRKAKAKVGGKRIG